MDPQHFSLDFFSRFTNNIGKSIILEIAQSRFLKKFFGLTPSLQVQEHYVRLKTWKCSFNQL